MGISEKMDIFRVFTSFKRKPAPGVGGEENSICGTVTAAGESWESLLQEAMTEIFNRSF